MRKLYFTLLISLSFLGTSYSQDSNSVLYTYESFLKSEYTLIHYWNTLIGKDKTIVEDELKLYADSTFIWQNKYSDCASAFFEYSGKWNIKSDTLLLYVDKWDKEPTNKTYTEIWIMKKKKVFKSQQPNKKWYFLKTNTK
ncbi:hypothetical protein EP331_07325 [bacterium]|nr:MAG: hypothetical protein EP331_07325 [bacterium]